MLVKKHGGKKEGHEIYNTNASNIVYPEGVSYAFWENYLRFMLTLQLLPHPCRMLHQQSQGLGRSSDQCVLLIV